MSDERKFMPIGMVNIIPPAWWFCKCCGDDCDCGCVKVCRVHRHRAEGGGNREGD
jgi:hypothetical protein